MRTKLIVLVAATFSLMLIVLTGVQMHLGQSFIVEAAEKRVARNIEAAWQIIDMRQRELDLTVDMCAQAPDKLATWRNSQDIDVLSQVEPSNAVKGTVTAAVLKKFAPTAGEGSRGIIALGKEDLSKEDRKLIDRCTIDGKVADALALFSAKRAEDGSVFVAAQVLTRADDLLWRIQRGLFGDELFEGKRTGTVTIFTNNRRTSTTVLKQDNSSAVGTNVSDEVAHHVLEKEQSWTAAAYVVDAWYMSRYDPIRDAGGEVVGMLYVGELRSKLIDQKRQVVLVGVSSIAAVMAFSFLGLMWIVLFERRAKADRNKVRFEFLQVLGHELKAPINAVEGYLGILATETLGPLPEKYVPLVKRSLLRIEYMRKLITDMLDLTRIEAGEKRREIVDDLDMAAILHECIETVQPTADARGVSIEIEAPDSLSLRADRGEIFIICNNLLTNAVKYNKDNGKVFVTLAREDNKLRLAVRDTGIGMKDADLAKLFGEFVRIRNEKTSKILGSGLGLHILKKIVALYQGEIIVESKEDEGSTFTVLLPLKST